jgi:hypothetical protein
LSKESLKYYTQEKNRLRFDKSINEGFKDMKHILKPMSFKNLISEFGHFNQTEIGAGKSFMIPLDI